jgi:hypothetical protein
MLHVLHVPWNCPLLCPALPLCVVVYPFAAENQRMLDSQLDIGAKMHKLPTPKDYMRLLRVVTDAGLRSVEDMFARLFALCLKLLAEGACARGADVRILEYLALFFISYPANTTQAGASKQPVETFGFQNPRSKVQHGNRTHLIQFPCHRYIWQCPVTIFALYVYMQMTVVGK